MEPGPSLARQPLSGLLPADAQLREEGADSPCIYHLFPVRLRDREAAAAAWHARGIQTGVHYAPAVHGHPAWGDRPLVNADMPRAEARAAEELSLPMHPDLRPEEIERVIDAVHDAMLAPVA